MNYLEEAYQALKRAYLELDRVSQMLNHLEEER